MPIDPELQPRAILAALGLHEPTSLSTVTGGNDTAIWRVEHGNATYALRVFRASQVAHWQRELATLDLAARAGLPVPVAHATTLWHDRPVVLLSWCAGQPLAVALQQQPWRVAALGRAFGAMQARIHRLAAPDGVAATDWIALSGADDTALQQRLRQLPAAPTSLLHLDYHPYNVLAQGNEISCVLDWVNAGWGDPRADVARTFTILRVEPYAPRESLVLALQRRLLTYFWQRGYEEVGARLGDMRLFYAWAGRVMARDLAPRVTQPDSWWRPIHLEQIRRWADQQAQRAGVAVEPPDQRR